ncbi:MAG: biotin--[acetyl-CoA-carboxylase] ligase [Acidobacteria bacterium]|nr:MAG: biotin--[acetyl-CoA-carboxylase] ligase [Acidobacteriota bacterium]
MPFDLEFVRQHWPQPVFYLATIDSTMLEAARLAEAGGPHGAVVVADEQTAGQGRHGHTWHSEPNSGLYVSIVLRPVVQADSLPVLTLALGLAAADAIAETMGLTCDLRWPNDVMLEGRKVAGILVQLLDSAAIAGIGVNVNHAGFPAEIAADATSLRIVSNRTHSREQLLVTLLGAADRYCGLLAGPGGKEKILMEFSRRSSYARNMRVKVDQGASVLEGVTAGLDPSGFLIVRRDDGTQQLVLAGGVRPG